MERIDDNGFVICAHCGKPIVNKYECIGHHTMPLTEENVNDYMISLNPNLIVLVHHVCHNKIHNKLGYIAKGVYLVYGSPLSGKSSFVKMSANEGDMIVDMDSIWQCVSGCDRYIKPNRLKSVVFYTRDLLIDSIRVRRGKWNNAYVIGGYPLIGERERLANALGAREVFIDTPQEECINRLKGSRERNFKEWEKYISDWWEKYNSNPPTS